MQRIAQAISKSLLYACFLLCLAPNVRAQSGSFLQVWGGPQYVSILNFQDFYPSNFQHYFGGDYTYRAGGGFDFIHNFSQNYGWQTGIYYSGQGQNYDGIVKNFYKPQDSVPVSYVSGVRMDYIRVPLMFRFNS